MRDLVAMSAKVIAGFGLVGCDHPELAGYTDSAHTYSTGVAIAPNVSIFGAGHNAAAALRHAVDPNPALPGGLVLNPATGGRPGDPDRGRGPGRRAVHRRRDQRGRGVDARDCGGGGGGDHVHARVGL